MRKASVATLYPDQVQGICPLSSLSQSQKGIGMCWATCVLINWGYEGLVQVSVCSVSYHPGRKMMVVAEVDPCSLKIRRWVASVGTARITVSSSSRKTCPV